MKLGDPSFSERKIFVVIIKYYNCIEFVNNDEILDERRMLSAYALAAASMDRYRAVVGVRGDLHC